MGENYFGITDQGRQRSNNEDSFIAQAGSGGFIIACVIDGVGGYEGGEVAARLCRQAVISSLDKMSANIIGQLISAFDTANDKIIKEKEISPQNENMACVVTLAMVNMEKNIFYFAHVGDTRLYLFRDGTLIKITRDHSTVGFLEESGRLTEEAAMMHPKRSEVNKVLGYEPTIGLEKDFIDTGESPFLPGDTILLCSDGLTDMITAGEIISILSTVKTLSEKCKLLVKAANDAGGRDNITVVLVNNDKLPAQHTITKPLTIPRKMEDHNNGKPTIITRNRNDKELIKSAHTKRINGWLLLFCILFFLGFIGALFKNNKKNNSVEQSVNGPVVKQRNKAELNFIDSINSRANAVVTLAAGGNIIITDTILIKNDSLHIVGNGNAFIRDSAYGGPAFVIATSCKYILFDSLSIQNFNVGVSMLFKGLHLNKVKFINCSIPLQFQERVSPGMPVSGKQAETIFYFADSLHK